MPNHSTETSPADKEYQALRIDRQIDAWIEFELTGGQEALASYFENGGELDEAVRTILVDLLRNGPRKNPGGSQPWRDYKTYIGVRMLMMKASDVIEQTEGISMTAACRLYAQKTNRELRTVQQQFDRGEAVFENWKRLGEE